MMLTKLQLMSMGFKFIGENVLVSDKASIYNAKNISIGDNTRIDDYTVISAGEGGINIGTYVHISTHVTMIASKAKIEIGNHCSIAAKCTMLSTSENYDGSHLMNPCHALEEREVIDKEVVMQDYSIIAVGCFVMPGVTIGFNSAVGAMSFVNKNIPEHTICCGVPAKFLKARKPLKIS